MKRSSFSTAIIRMIQSVKLQACASIIYPLLVYLGYQLIESSQDGFILPVWYREDPNTTLSDLTVEFTILSSKDAYFSSIPFSSPNQTGKKRVYFFNSTNFKLSRIKNASTRDFLLFLLKSFFLKTLLFSYDFQFFREFLFFQPDFF